MKLVDCECKDCGIVFEEFDDDEVRIVCPDCDSDNVVVKISVSKYRKAHSSWSVS